MLNDLSGDFKVPDVAGEIVGYRAFVVRNNRLCSVARRYVWEPGPLQAYCNNVDSFEEEVFVNDGDRLKKITMSMHGLIPDPNCMCGFWFYKDSSGCRPQMAAKSVVGRVKAWGRVLEGVSGWRAEYAQVDALLGSTNRWGDLHLDRVAAYYDVPIIGRGEGAAIKGVLTEVRSNGKTPTGRNRPLDVTIGESMLKCWPGVIEHQLARSIGEEIAVEYEIKEFRGQVDMFITHVHEQQDMDL